MRVRIKVEGADKLVKNLQRIGKTASRRSLSKATKAGAEPIVNKAKELAPVDTGKMRDAIRSKFAYQSSRAVRVEISSRMKPEGASWHSYDFYQEFGTSHHPAQPFMRPAADYEKDRAVEIVRKTVQDAVLEEVRKLGS